MKSIVSILLIFTGMSCQNLVEEPKRTPTLNNPLATQLDPYPSANLLLADKELVIGNGTKRLFIGLVGQSQVPSGPSPLGLDSFLFGIDAQEFAKSYDATIAIPYRNNQLTPVWRYHFEGSQVVYDDLPLLKSYLKCRIDNWLDKTSQSRLAQTPEIYLFGYSNGSGYAGCLSASDSRIKGTLFLGAPDTFDACGQDDRSGLAGIFLYTRGDNQIAQPRKFKQWTANLRFWQVMEQIGIPSSYERNASQAEKQEKKAWFRHLRAIEPSMSRRAFQQMICHPLRVSKEGKCLNTQLR